MSRECNLLSSVSSQQKSEATDVKALGVPQLSDRYCYSSSLLGRPCYSSWTDQFYLEIKENISSRCEGMLYQKTQREERERGTETESVWERERDPRPIGSSFYMFFPPPGPALCKLDEPGVLFVLPEALTPVLRPSFVLFLWAFPFLVF